MGAREPVSQSVIKELEQFSTAYISDAMARLGLHHGWLPGLYPRTSFRIEGSIVGRAFTVQWGTRQGPQGSGLTMYHAIRERTDEDILVVAGGRADAYLLGDNTCTAARVEGFRAVVVDGCVRDSRGLREVGIEVLSTGVEGGHPHDLEVIAYNVPVIIGYTRITGEHLVAVDEDGAVVFPEVKAEEILQHVRRVAELEKIQQDIILRRGSLAELARVLELRKGG